MINAYIDMVRVYLTQELPQPYNTQIAVVNNRIRVTLQISDSSFSEEFALIKSLIEASIYRIRNREIDLPFTVSNRTELKDFTVYKK